MPPRHIDPAIRLMRRVAKADGDACWLWTGSVSTTGYGTIRAFDRTLSTHVLSYMLHRGDVPDGMHVLHRCDVRLCVRPDHLFLGTHVANMEDMVAKRRVRAGRGKPLSPEQRSEALALVRGGHPIPSVAARYGVTRNAIDKLLWRAREGGDAAAITGSRWFGHQSTDRKGRPCLVASRLGDQP
jgi:hypothetical protein